MKKGHTMKKGRIFGFVVAALLTLVFTGTFGLSGCDNVNLAEYKVMAVNTIETHASTKIAENGYSNAGLQAIAKVVTDGKAAVDVAGNKDEVDMAVSVAKEGIDKVETDKIIPMYGAEEYTDGNGTENTPYIIKNRGQLINFSNQINNGENLDAHFALGADIDLDGMEWTPIGIFEHYYGNDVFSGVFDGNGYEISNFRITVRHKNTSAKNIGLFGCNGGTIKNLGVVGVDIDVAWRFELGFNLSISAGGIAGSNIGSITNCYAIGNIKLDYYKDTSITTSPYQVKAGGLVGGGNGNLANCYAAVDVNANYSNDAGSAYAAGLTVEGSAKNCYATGGVSSNMNCYQLGAASSFGVGDISNNYIYEGQVVSGALWGPYIPSCTSEELNDPAFYTDKLGWSTDDWNLDNLDFVDGKYIDGKYPRLKKNCE